MREISRRLQISRKAVKAIIQQQGQCVPQPRRDKIHIDTELLERLHRARLERRTPTDGHTSNTQRSNKDALRKPLRSPSLYANRH
jgi:hypothetical protein